MKSHISAAAFSERKRETRIFVSAIYICLSCISGIVGRTLKWPPWLGSSSAAKTVGESKSGKQKKSMDESIPTRAAVRKLPITP